MALVELPQGSFWHGLRNNARFTILQHALHAMLAVSNSQGQHCAKRGTLAEMREKLKEAAMKYRLLKAGEIIKEGDQFLLDGEKKWNSSVTVGEYAGWSPFLEYRRPIKSTSRTSANSRLRKCPHCGKSLRRALPKAANVVRK